jgi:hypothetical protein
MAASREDIRNWFQRAEKEGDKYMIIVCDTFDHDDYPIFCKDAVTCMNEYDDHNGKNMQRIMEVYDISLGWEAQSHGRVMNMPKAEDRPKTKVDIMKEIVVIGVTEGPEKGRHYTRGMSKFGKPELEIRDVPLFLGPAATQILNAVADYMINDEADIKLGQNMALGDRSRCVFKFEKLKPLNPDSKTEYWTLTDKPLTNACANPHCKHDH